MHVLGSGAIEQAVRCVLELRHSASGVDDRILCITKSNYIPRQEKGMGFRLSLDANLNLQFSGQRSYPEGSKSKIPDETKDRIIELWNQGNKGREIHRILIAEGVKIGNTTVADFLKKAKEDGLLSDSIGNDPDGQE